MSDPELVFFDGSCGLCHGTVKFVLARDRAGAFAFAPLHGETFNGAFDAAARAAIPDTVVVRTRDGRTLVRSDAVVHLLRTLGGGWGALGTVLRAIPRPLRDLGYRGVARVRRAVLATPASVCPVVPPEVRNRFRP